MKLYNISGDKPSPGLLLPQLCHTQAQKWFSDSWNRPFLAVVTPLSECRHTAKANRLLLYFCSRAIGIHGVGFFKQYNLKLILLSLSHQPEKSLLQEAHQGLQNRGEQQQGSQLPGSLRSRAQPLEDTGNLPAGVQILVV